MRAILIIAAVFCAGLGAAAQFGKLSVIYDTLNSLYPAHEGVGVGLLVSIIGIVGLVFGTTAGGLVTRIGSRRVVLTALALGAAISLVQSLGLPYWLFLATRLPEGLSHLAIVVVGPTMMATAAPQRFQSLAMSLWGSFFGLTFTVLAYFGPAIVAEAGPGRLFQYHALWLILCLVALRRLLPRDPPPGARTLPVGVLAQHLATYRSPRIAAPALGFVCYTVTYVAALTLLPGAVDPGWGPTVAVAMPLVSIVMSLTLGVWLLGRTSAVRVVEIGFAIAIVAAAGLWAVWGWGAAETGFACLLAAAMGIVQGASFAAIPQLMADPADRASAAGAIAQLGNLGTTTGTPMLALILTQAGATGLALFLIAFSALGILAHRVLERRRMAG